MTLRMNSVSTKFWTIIRRPIGKLSMELLEIPQRPVTESVTARAADREEILVMNVSTVATEQSELREMVLCETDKRGIPVNREEFTPERRRPENKLPGALQQVKMRNNQWNCLDHCYSAVVEKTKTTDGPLPIGSEILLPRSREMVSFEDQDAPSAPLSPHRVREGHSLNMPAEESHLLSDYIDIIIK